MSNYRRAHTEGATYFFTVVTFRRRKILCHEQVRINLRAGIREARIIHPFKIDAWVLLPDHMHCIWTLPPGDANYGLRWAMIKRFVTKHCAEFLHLEDMMNASKRKRKESTIWQRRYWEHQIRDDRDYQMHMDYLHYNPVKYGYVKQIKDWPYSSFFRYVEEGVYSEDWCGGNIVDIPMEYDS